MKTFKCENCQQEFQCGWAEEEAQLEYKLVFGREIDEQAAVVCDDCYKEIMRLDLQ